MIGLTCTPTTFRLVKRYPVRWLDWHADFEKAQALWPPTSPLTPEAWRDARLAAYRYCGVVERTTLIACAAVWRYSETAWEVAAVSTRPEYRRRGYGQAVVAFVTGYILQQGRVATCHMAADNVAMQRTAERVGFVETSPAT